MKELRVLLASDIHNCHQVLYGMDNETRMKDFVRCIEEEKARTHYDLTLILGDVSLDFWSWNEGGSYLWNPSVSCTKEFMETIAPHLPQPAYILPGNHEQYAPEDWLRFTGQPREQIVSTPLAAFVMLDSFSGNLGPDFNSDGTYQPVNVGLIRRALKENPGVPVFLCAHWFDMEAESDEFRELLKNERRIRALFMGHDHRAAVTDTGEDAGSLPMIRTGNFSYSGENDFRLAYRGWRELVVREDGAFSTLYIVPEQRIPLNPEEPERMPAHTQDEWTGIPASSAASGENGTIA